MASNYRKGFWLTLGGALAFTPDALLIRLTAVDPFTLASGRGLLAGMVILITYTLFISGGFTKALKLLGWWGLFFARPSDLRLTDVLCVLFLHERGKCVGNLCLYPVDRCAILQGAFWGNGDPVDEGRDCLRCRRFACFGQWWLTGHTVDW